MPFLSERARARLIQWMDANPDISQTTIGRAVGHGQGWVSKYRQGTQEADIDELDGMARVFNHTLAELVDLRPDPNEQALLDRYRALPERRRRLMLSTMEEMIPAQRRGPRSTGNR